MWKTYLCWGVKVWRKRRPPPRRRAIGVLVQGDGERSTGLKVAVMGPVRRRREPVVSPITRAAGGEGMGAWGREPDASPECHTERG